MIETLNLRIEEAERYVLEHKTEIIKYFKNSLSFVTDDEEVKLINEIINKLENYDSPYEQIIKPFITLITETSFYVDEHGHNISDDNKQVGYELFEHLCRRKHKMDGHIHNIFDCYIDKYDYVNMMIQS